MDRRLAAIFAADMVGYSRLMGADEETFGRGALYNPDGKQIGWAAINITSVGLQAGVQGFRMLMVLENQHVLQEFKEVGELEGALERLDRPAPQRPTWARFRGPPGILLASKMSRYTLASDR